MRAEATVAVVIPALNEERAIAKVLRAIPLWVDEVIVVDNGSVDSTAEHARVLGARVIVEPVRGYGSACQAGIRGALRADVFVFLDADYSDYPQEMALIVDPIVAREADLVIGSRLLGRTETGALSIAQRVGNQIACRLMRWIWGVWYTDLGPFRAIRGDTLSRLQMRDPDFGWTVEMQVNAARHGVRAIEVPVSYRRRIGASKISGTVWGSIRAGVKILVVILSAALHKPVRVI